MLKRAIKKETQLKILKYVFIIVLVMFALYYAILKTRVLNYYAMNGDFQNYNIFRRMLNGQVMFKDFSNYLGIGIVILNLPFLLFSNSLFTSMFITTFTSYLCFYIIAYFLANMIFKNSKFFSITSTLLIIIFMEVSVVFNLKLSLVNFYQFLPGNSMKIERGFLPIVICVLIYYFSKKTINKKNIICNKNLIIIGLISGANILWSNDFGFASVISEIILLILMLIKQKTNFLESLKKMFIFLITVFISFVIMILIVSGGNISSYFDITLGIAQYQYWYYDNSPAKIATFTQILSDRYFLLYFLFSIVIFISYIVKLVKNRYDTKDIAYVYIILTNLLATGIYYYGSGGKSYNSFIYVLFSTGVLLYLKAIINNGKKYNINIKKFFIIVLPLAIILLTNKYSNLIKDNNISYENFKYEEKLKGKIYYKKELDELKKIIGKEKVFSVYASAYEAINDIYHPTKYDYIIHVLGDNARKQYIEKFLEGNYKYVLTIEGNYSSYSAWIKRSNWFFYKELYKNYRMVKKIGYNILWEKIEKPHLPQEKPTVKYEKIKDSYKIYATNISKENLILDLQIKYSVSRKKAFCSLNVFKTSVLITDNSSYEEQKYLKNNYYLKGGKNTYNIPLVINSKNNSIILSPYPKCTEIELDSVIVKGIYYNYNLENEKKLK